MNNYYSPTSLSNWFLFSLLLSCLFSTIPPLCEVHYIYFSLPSFSLFPPVFLFFWHCSAPFPSSALTQAPLYPVTSIHTRTTASTFTPRFDQLSFTDIQNIFTLSAFAYSLFSQFLYLCIIVNVSRWLSLASLCVKWRHEKRGGMVEQYLSLQWGAFCRLETRAQTRTHAHSQSHGWARVWLQWGDSSFLAVTPKSTPFCDTASPLTKIMMWSQSGALSVQFMWLSSDQNTHITCSRINTRHLTFAISMCGACLFACSALLLLCD